MSGHSKWSKVKHQKATTDVVKAKVFTKASAAIAVAIKEGGGITDPSGNTRLRFAIEQAKAVNMPKENIERAILKASGQQSETYERLIYEGFGPENVPLLIEATTDNRQRTVAQVKNAIERNGGRFAPGAVLHQFNRLGQIVIRNHSGVSFDTILEDALAAGVSDVSEGREEVTLFCPPEMLGTVQAIFEEKGYSINNAEINYRPILSMHISQHELLKKLILVLEECDDVQRVYSGAEMV